VHIPGLDAGFRIYGASFVVPDPGAEVSLKVRIHAWRYAVWPNSRSRSRGLWSSENCTFQSLSPPAFTERDGKWPL